MILLLWLLLIEIQTVQVELLKIAMRKNGVIRLLVKPITTQRLAMFAILPVKQDTEE